MKYRKFLLGTIIIFGFLSFIAPVKADSAKREKCYNSSLEEAVHMRAIQSRLMVAALSCEGAKARYNSFAIKFKTHLADNGKVLNSYFKCMAGKKSRHHMDKMITSIANIAANMNSDDHESFCEEADEIFTALEDIDTEEFGEVCSKHAFLNASILQK